MEVAKLESKEDLLKNEVIAELGLSDKVKKFGWKSLTAKETGRIGGIMAKRKKLFINEKSQQA
ncbi:MAG: small, acid-soluble spore protein, alpha/beta type [Bacillota bacterium]|nr:small, acid-soluble spore protein, alpha/beta type [Bacillota bacterium]